MVCMHSTSDSREREIQIYYVNVLLVAWYFRGATRLGQQKKLRGQNLMK